VAIHDARAPDVVRRGGDRRLADGVEDRGRDGPAIEAPRPDARDALERAREVGVAERRADVARGAVGVEVQRRRRGRVVEPVDVLLRLADERLVDDEPLAGDPDRGPQRLRERERAVAAQRRRPPAHGAGNADRQAAVARRVERQRRAVLDEGAGVHRLRRALAVVVGAHAPPAGVVGDHEAAAADAARERLGDAEHGRRRDGGVGRVVAAAKRPDRLARRQAVDRRGGAAAAGRGRGGGVQGRWRGGVCGRRRGDRDGERDRQRAAKSEAGHGCGLPASGLAEARRPAVLACGSPEAQVAALKSSVAVMAPSFQVQVIFS
jgi:hypothetical protein